MKAFVLLLVLLSSCTKDKKVDRVTLYTMGKKVNSDIKLVLAETLGGGPSCEGENGEDPYGEGCLRVLEVEVGAMILRCVEFASEKTAKKEAIRIKEYFYRNWVFDEVRGEPPLESFVQKAFGAKLAE